jgi:hypothetical protein
LGHRGHYVGESSCNVELKGKVASEHLRKEDRCIVRTGEDCPGNSGARTRAAYELTENSNRGMAVPLRGQSHPRWRKLRQEAVVFASAAAKTIRGGNNHGQEARSGAERTEACGSKSPKPARFLYDRRCRRAAVLSVPSKAQESSFGARNIRGDYEADVVVLGSGCVGLHAR